MIERICGQPAGFQTQQKECKCQMKKISVLIPCYNEQENVVPISEAVIGILTRELPQYDYELVFIDRQYQAAAAAALRGESEDQSDL